MIDDKQLYVQIPKPVDIAYKYICDTSNLQGNNS